MGAVVEPSSIAPVVALAAPSSDADRCAHGGAPSKLDVAVRRAQTKDALIGLGWKPTIAATAVAAAFAALGPQATLEQLIFEALRRCRRPIATAERDARAP
jgi:Holliday junction resolvasome RuvABC DNA-binding subunit